MSCLGFACQRTTEDDRVGDRWRRAFESPLTVVEKFNDWCLTMTGGSHPRGVYPLHWLAACGYRRTDRMGDCTCGS